MFWRKKQKEETTPEESKDTQQEPVEKSSELQPPSGTEEITPTTPEEPALPQDEPTEEEPPQKKGLFAKLRDRLWKTSESIAKKTMEVFRLRGKINEDLLEDLEEILISADVGVDTTLALMDELRDRIRREKKSESEDLEWLTDTMQDIMRDMLNQGNRDLKTAENGPSIYLIVGVNGVGKTTAIGKLAHRLKNEGKNVLVVAADTFRAAAINQLVIWSQRAGVSIVTGKEGSDPSSVVYNAMQEARKQNSDAVIIDTAGRLHTKSNLMNELGKMSRVISREYENAPQETLLVLDASTGQNALEQAKKFLEFCKVSGLILTKLDGTAKGGVILSLHKQLELPVKFIGVGEALDDLEPFNAEAFCKALFQSEVVRV